MCVLTNKDIISDSVKLAEIAASNDDKLNVRGREANCSSPVHASHACFALMQQFVNWDLTLLKFISPFTGTYCR